MIRKLRHPNIVRLLDVFCKVENEQNDTALFDWYEEIERDPVQLDLPGDNGKACMVKVQKWYIVQELCSCSVQDLLNLDDLLHIPLDIAHQYVCWNTLPYSCRG